MRTPTEIANEAIEVGVATEQLDLPLQNRYHAGQWRGKLAQAMKRRKWKYSIHIDYGTWTITVKRKAHQ